MSMKELCLDARVDNLGSVFALVIDELTAHGCAKKDIRQVKLCVEEVFINISRYAYSPKTGKTTVSIDVTEKPGKFVKAVICFVDNGKPFDPLKESPPDLDAELEDRDVGGLGIFLVRVKMDAVSYEYRDGKNVFTMRKYLNYA